MEVKKGSHPMGDLRVDRSDSRSGQARAEIWARRLEKGVLVGSERGEEEGALPNPP